MTDNELQRIAMRLANTGWCRYWIHFNRLIRPWLMAIQVLDREGDVYRPAKVKWIEDFGFEPAAGFPEEEFIYVIARTDEDGGPFWITL